MLLLILINTTVVYGAKYYVVYPVNTRSVPSLVSIFSSSHFMVQCLLRILIKSESKVGNDDKSNLLSRLCQGPSPLSAGYGRRPYDAIGCFLLASWTHPECDRIGSLYRHHGFFTAYRSIGSSLSRCSVAARSSGTQSLKHLIPAVATIRVTLLLTDTPPYRAHLLHVIRIHQVSTAG